MFKEMIVVYLKKNSYKSSARNGNLEVPASYKRRRYMPSEKWKKMLDFIHIAKCQYGIPSYTDPFRALHKTYKQTVGRMQSRWML
jgi:hypothetical protein